MSGAVSGAPAADPARPGRSPLEMWAGIECTVNRVGDRWLDQLERSGHAHRLADVDLVAELGVRAVRYPVLWERTAPDGVPDWTWPDARLHRLRERGVEPIVGLVHHGSGPRGTSLLDDGFPSALARYARQVAERYPWVRRWTPINEPLTTARFSALYGHWYPHARSDRAFVRALLNQVRATVLAMREIRRVIPGAELVQTEDLGITHATRPLAGQAAFENERRWLSFDLLCGRVDRDHALHRYLHGAGAGDDELARLRDEPVPPDVLGLNYYLTSERFLDHRLRRYPRSAHGGNGRQRYADVEAVRARVGGIGGAAGALRAAWARYGLPLAVTEAHLACTREQQLRWLHEVWTDARRVRAEGADVRAVTAWSLFGAVDWHNLVTSPEGVYEPGVFDVRAPRPRPTALAVMVRDLATRGEHRHPALAGPGWWRSGERLTHAPPLVRRARILRERTADAAVAPPLLVTGAGGRLATAFARACEERRLAHRALRRDELDAADPAAVARALDDLAPWAVVNAAGYARVEAAERDADACYRANVAAAATLAEACAERGVALLTLSSELVFDGARDAPYVESDATRPLGVHGRSLVAAERCVLHRLPSALVVRTAAAFGPWDAWGFPAELLAALACGHAYEAADDVIVSPTYLPDLATAALDLLIDGERGVWHLANEGAVSWAEFGRRLAEARGLDPALVVPVPASRLALAPRPPRAVLGTERGSLLPTLDRALQRFAAHRAVRAMA